MKYSQYIIFFCYFFLPCCFGEEKLPLVGSVVSGYQVSPLTPLHHTHIDTRTQKGSVTKHYTFFPLVNDGLVVLSDPETGEVFYTTHTDQDGSFDVDTTELPEGSSEFTLINVTGGGNYGASRPDSNILQALVRTDSFSRGSVTVSLPTTAAYQALQEHKQDITKRNLYRVHEVNLNKVTRMLYQDVSQWSYETAYLNVKGGRLEEAHWFDNNDFMNDKVIGGTSSLFEVMAMEGEDQIHAIKDYFSELEGWGYIDPLLLDSFPVEISFIGEAVFDIRVTREKDGQLISDTIYSGVSDPNSIEIKYPTLMAEFGEKIKISPLLPPDSIINNWMGCNDINSENCTYTIGRESHEIVGFIGVNPEYVNEVEAKLFNDNYYDYSESVFTGKAGVALSKFEKLEDYLPGERIVTSEKIYFYVEEIIIPEIANSNEEFKLRVSLDHESNNLPGEYDMRYIDYWRMIFGRDAPYQPNALIPLSWDDASRTGEALLTGPIMYSAAEKFGVLTKPSEVSSGEPYSLMLSHSSHCIEKSIPEDNVPKQLKSISFNGTYKICVNSPL